MAGHNKWSKVKHIKGAADAKRSKLFSKLAKEITVAARDGGGDVELNARLRQAVGNAKKQSLPGDTIERAIKKELARLRGLHTRRHVMRALEPEELLLLLRLLLIIKTVRFQT